MPGTVLLIAVSPTGKARMVDAASVLSVLAAVPPAILSGTETANVVELADPLEPQAVLTRLRAAAAAPGPLTVFVTGQLHLDRKQRLPHLALARTTPATVRYTGLPWHWVREELRLRPAGATTLVLDLYADPEVWERLRTVPLDFGRNNAVHGRIAPPPARREIGSPSYMKAVATVLRSGHRPAMAELHRQVVARLGAEVASDILLSTHTPAGGDPHDAISAAVRDGRYAEADELAARWEQAAARAHGPASEDALHWSEVRADLAMFAGDAARSCRTWLTVAHARLAAGQPADAPAVEAAVDRAHHQWGAIKDTARARELGPALAELRLRVPGRREGALDHVQQHLRQLQTS